MVKSVEIPQDIIDSVIAAVGDDAHLLKTCALVSSSFLLPSRKHLFSRITLKSDQTCQGIHQFFVQNPVIQSFVRSISLANMEHKNSEWMDGSTSLLAFLRLPFPCLEGFSIQFRNEYYSDGHWCWLHKLKPLKWDTLNSELKDVLSNIAHLPTLKTLSLYGISKVPTSFFLHIVHLTTLELHTFSLIDFGFGDENSRSLTLAASKGEAPMVSHAVIDRCLWHINPKEHLRIPYKPKFLPFMCRLRFFEISVGLDSPTRHNFHTLSVLMDSLCISLTSPATLEHLQFNINIFCDGEGNDGLRDAEVWSHLDSIATHPTGSQLQRVDININYCLRKVNDAMELDKDEVEKAVLDSLPSLRAKGILFVEAGV